MKKIIFILAVFVSFVANSQYTPPTGYTNINSRYDWLAGVFRALGLPAGGNAAFTTGQAQRAGAVYYDSTGVDAGLKVWNGAAWVGVGEVTQSALDDTAAAIRADHWAVRGNAVAQDTSKFIGTTDSAAIALRIRVNNYNAGYIGYAYQTSNPPYTNDGNNYTGDVALGWRALDSTRKRIDAGIAGNGGSIAIGSDALRDNTLTANVAIGNNAGKRGRTLHRNVIVGNGALQFGYDGEFNVAVGQFAMEVQDGVDGNTGIGAYALRGNKMGSGNTSVGRESSTFGTTTIESITITNGGSGYTSATVTISAPETATPGTFSTQATATATVNAGAVTAITITNKGSGYSSTKTPITVTITGDGTGATGSVVLKSASNNTVVGFLADRWNNSGQGNTSIGAEAAYGTTVNHRGFYDDDITVVGFRASRGTSRGQSTPFKYSTAIGSNAKFECDSCFILGTTFTRAGSGTTNPDASAQLDVTSTTRGFLPPRMSAAQRTAIASPASGLIVFDLDSLSTFQYNGSAWQNLYNTGSGTTPTLQQVLTSGSTLTGNNTITNDYVLSMAGNSAVAFGDLFSVTNSSTTGRAINAASAGTNSTIQAVNTKTSSGGGGAIWAAVSGSSAAVSVNRDSSSTATVVRVLDVNRTTSGTAADGIGASIHFNVENQSGSGFFANSVESIWKNSIDASKESMLRIRGLDNTVEKVFMDVQTGGVVIVNDGADTLATKAYARSVGGGGGGGANTALSNLASVAINESLISDADNTDDLGSTSISWKDIYGYRHIFKGSTSGETIVQATAIAGTTTVTLPAVTGTVVLREGTETLSGAKSFSTRVQVTGGLSTASNEFLSNVVLAASNAASRTTNSQHLVEGASGIGLRMAMYGSASTTLTANDAYANLVIASTSVTEAASGTHPLIAGISLRAPSITGGSATLSNTATLYIDAAPSATVTGANYALWVKAGTAKFGGTVQLQSYTVATLPAGVQGDIAYVTDATAPTYLATVVGGGAVVTPVFFDGTNWVAH